MVCGLVCSPSSAFSSGLFSAGVFGLRFPLCMRVRARVLAHLVFLRERNILTKTCS